MINKATKYAIPHIAIHLSCFPFQTPNYSGYLTSEQALADYVDLISYLRFALRATETPVVVFGGSYGGMLAAWFRIKYPHIVQG